MTFTYLAPRLVPRLGARLETLFKHRVDVRVPSWQTTYDMLLIGFGPVKANRSSAPPSPPHLVPETGLHRRPSESSPQPPSGRHTRFGKPTP